MDETVLALLRQYDTPTICNAIEVVQGKRGFSAFTRGTVLASEPTSPAMVGYAATASIAGLKPSGEDPAIIRSRRMDYYRTMAEAPKPSVAVIEDLDYPDCVSAYWGEVNTSIHKAFGLSGALTNGVMRDLGDLATDFPVLAGSIGPSHGFVHVCEIGIPVTLFGLTVNDGDLIHADRHGALVIPPDVVSGLQYGIKRLLAAEQVILAPAKQPGGFDFATFERAWEAFEKART